MFLATLLANSPAALSTDAWRVAGLAAWMAIWWATQAVPLYATSLLPLVVLPVLGIRSEAEAAAPFASPVVFLFLGGFLLAAAVEHWRLHERIAYATALRVGTTPGRMVGGFMLATAALSGVMSNTAAVLVMLPMGLSVARLLPADHPDERHLRLALLLGIAYAASIGGLTTLIGTPPNALLAAYARDHLDDPIGFARWVGWALPFVAIGLVLAWLLLTRVLLRVHLSEIPGGRQAVADRLQALGPLAPGERRTALVFGLVALLWLVGPLLQDHIPLPGDAGIAIAGAILLFLIPSGVGRPLLVWQEAKQIPWGTLLLFGGGLSLAAAMQVTGLAQWLGDGLIAVVGSNPWLLIPAATLLALVLTELMSNTAVAAMMLPILAGVGVSAGLDPMLLLVPVTLATTCGFMMPAGTPPNALVIGTGAVDAPSMVRVGFWMNLLFLTLILGYTALFGRFVW